MIFRQFYLEGLGHASYLLGSEESGDAFVLDVRRDVDGYFAAARTDGLRIRYAADTHQHNDYLSGVRELPERGAVEILASSRAKLGYPARPLADGDRLEIGEIVLEAMHTPGHTTEHVSFLVRDRSRGEEPVMLLSGGALLVGDVARPDLLGGEEETKTHAAELCRTLREKILALPDHVEVWPTHVKGSLCGGSIGSRLSTTIGYERRMNPMLRDLSRASRFVAGCLDLKDLPAVPPYWPRMRKANLEGPKLVGRLGEPPALRPDAFERLREDGAVVIDCRSAEAFGGGHVPGAWNVGAGPSFLTWAGSVLPAQTPYLLVLERERERELWEICWDLLRIGYDLPDGWLAGGMLAWRTAAKPLERLDGWTVRELHERLERDDDLLVLDVRQPKEWSAGRIRRAMHVTGAELLRRIDEIPAGRPIATICGSGYRSSVAASVLRSRGRRIVANVLGGMSAWTAAGLPIER